MTKTTLKWRVDLITTTWESETLAFRAGLGTRAWYQDLVPICTNSFFPCFFWFWGCIFDSPALQSSQRGRALEPGSTAPELARPSLLHDVTVLSKYNKLEGIFCLSLNRLTLKVVMMVMMMMMMMMRMRMMRMMMMMMMMMRRMRMRMRMMRMMMMMMRRRATLSWNERSLERNHRVGSE